MGRDQSVIDDEELELIERVFELDDLTVRDMMIHANRVDSLDSQRTLAEVRQIIFDCTHTRLPVYENRVNNIVGVVHQRELLRALAEDKDQLTVQELASQPLFVLPTTKGDDMLNVFLKQKKHLAVVVDIQGSMLGVITLEDVIEELVGNIEDETDLEIEDVQLIGPNKVLAIPEAMSIKDWEQISLLRMTNRYQIYSLIDTHKFHLEESPSFFKMLKLLSKHQILGMLKRY
jgi:CBS domain containing-hemolysin-like protein